MGLCQHYFSHHYVQFLLFINWLYIMHFFSHHYVQFLFCFHWFLTMHFFQSPLCSVSVLALVGFKACIFSVSIMFSFYLSFPLFLNLHFFSCHYVQFLFCFHWFLSMHFFQSPLCSVSVFAFIAFIPYLFSVTIMFSFCFLFHWFLTI